MKNGFFIPRLTFPSSLSWMTLALLLVVMALPQHLANAQSVVFRPTETFDTLSRSVSGQLFYVNGRQVHWFNTPPDQQFAGLEKLILSLAALRLADQNKLNLGARLSTLDGMPDLEGFYAALPTVEHILTESAGIATPPEIGNSSLTITQLSNRQFTHYLLTQRAPGNVSSADPVAWAYLSRLITHVSGQTLSGALSDLVFRPLAIDGNETTVSVNAFKGTHMPIQISLSPSTMTSLLKAIVRNRTVLGDAFLKPASHDVIIRSRDMRVGPSRGYGFAQYQAGDIEALTITPTLGQGIAAIYVPRADTVFGMIGSDSSEQSLFKAVAELIAQTLPPTTDQSNTSAQALAPSSDLSGIYIEASRAPVWLAERLDSLRGPRVAVRKSTEDYQVQFDSELPQIYQQREPYRLFPKDADRPTLTFTRYRNGGFLSIVGQTYRRVDSLVHAGRLADFVPYALLLILTASIYIIRPEPRTRRNMGLAAMSGSLMAGTGLYLELTFWPHVLYGMDMPSLIVAWRTMLNIGAMLCLSLPFYVVAITRSGAKADERVLNPIMRLHLLMVALSSVFLILMLTALGILGAFRAF